ncbi:hypothetical protein [Rhodobacter sp. NSM]|uniref:hypothetical protein n=1 Tax=Rhodobacter sp. NSM TaxID=3457501 RepID=UPI003FD29E28
MAWTFHQFDDDVTEVVTLGPTRMADGCRLREVTIKGGNTFLIDADLIFGSREEAEASRVDLGAC